MKPNNLVKDQLTKESIFIIGYVSSVSGRSVKVKVNKNKNTSHILYNGDILKNTSVNSYIKIAKGFTNIIGKVEGEYISIIKNYNSEYGKNEDTIERYLEVSLFGHFNGNKFEQGIKEMPLVDNECYLLDKKEFEELHQFYKPPEKTITVGCLADEPGQEIKVAINNLFASHIGIFGNTGSGKSNTLAKIYYELFQEMDNQPLFKAKSKFVIIDFNGEYGNKGDNVITNHKKVYTLNTRNDSGNKIPLSADDLIDLELLSILSNATEKTQKPFIERTVSLYTRIHDKISDDEIIGHFRNSLKDMLVKTYFMANKEKAYILLDNFEYILSKDNDSTKFERLPWHNGGNGQQDKGFIPFDYKSRAENTFKLVDNDIYNLNLYKSIDTYTFPLNSISKFIHFLYLQIIYDVYRDKAQNEHISPAINKLKSKQKDIEKVFDTNCGGDIFGANQNLIVINLKETNLDIKKTLPLLISKKLYENHKSGNFKKESLHIIIDEAHNILSDVSERESESWKDYRLETFEEIIKEGRKFNTFLTIASQRPSDISPTIISQLHNYFIHKLINDFDINAIHKTVSYLDKLSFESIPILPTGTCFFAGVATNLPVKVSVKLLDADNRPNSETVKLEKIWGIF